uniref:EGF-like domain-containing protein n=1 Tax=Chromera velia CCMP2878 TaxID=1169474 RepID=A0A0G4GAN5_9ALVE|mmetsp:Transcript_41589/g.82069  ORF Transcript_41589/g.82069 Transcript_41589/m.82069 type:complete len:294 (+) Transcript_41589:146-1027(+)|eukprot:Cvel_4434.t1-p1 / transcript=Cvel_4434.t1 / gene=Cvel_4434 / organism=Chromera_velia_CCMP2878 / gene_product=hypothetical protein / transcript_product=hypothetical protein / location=Cvel_scaffold193:39349-40227(-) / protein_length=293 / sequence_SO=supercontig / SO=protein_coding / is_pseudo=false
MRAVLLLFVLSASLLYVSGQECIAKTCAESPCAAQSTSEACGESIACLDGDCRTGDGNPVCTYNFCPQRGADCALPRFGAQPQQHLCRYATRPFRYETATPTAPEACPSGVNPARAFCHYRGTCVDQHHGCICTPSFVGKRCEHRLSRLVISCGHTDGSFIGADSFGAPEIQIVASAVVRNVEDGTTRTVVKQTGEYNEVSPSFSSDPLSFSDAEVYESVKVELWDRDSGLAGDDDLLASHEVDFVGIDRAETTRLRFYDVLPFSLSWRGQGTVRCHWTLVNGDPRYRRGVDE